MSTTLRYYIDIIMENLADAEDLDWWYTMDSQDSNQIMQRIWRSKYQNVPLYFGDDEDQPFWSTQKNLTYHSGGPNLENDDEFFVSTRGNASDFEEGTVVSIDTAFTGKYKGVIKEYIRACFAHMEQEFKEEYPGHTPPNRILMLYSRDGSDYVGNGGETVWQHIARSLNARLEES
mgnify:CR=1 FL=1